MSATRLTTLLPNHYPKAAAPPSVPALKLPKQAAKVKQPAPAKAAPAVAAAEEDDDYEGSYEMDEEVVELDEPLVPAVDEAAHQQSTAEESHAYSEFEEAMDEASPAALASAAASPSTAERLEPKVRGC